MDYQEKASRTWIDRPDFEITDDQVMILWAASGIAGEAGEVMDNIKKGIFHQRGIDVSEIDEELGDLLWYIAALCTVLGLDMDRVMNNNIRKLEIRYPYGYNPDHANERMDKDEKHS